MFRLEFHAKGANELPLCFPDDNSAFERAMTLFACYCPEDTVASARVLDLTTGDEKIFGCIVWCVYAYLYSD